MLDYFSIGKLECFLKHPKLSFVFCQPFYQKIPSSTQNITSWHMIPSAAQEHVSKDVHLPP